MVHYFSTVSKILFLNPWVLLRFRIFCLSSSFVACQGDDWNFFTSLFFWNVWFFFLFFLNLFGFTSCAKILEQLKPLFTLVKTNCSIWVNPQWFGIYSCTSVNFWELGCYCTAVKCKTRWRTIRTFMYVKIINEWIDNYYTVPCVKKKCWLRIIIFRSFNNCLHLQVAGHLILVVQGTTMFHDLVVSINFWCSLMTGCPLISNRDIFRHHPHVSGYFLNPQIFLCRLKNFHVHT